MGFYEYLITEVSNKNIISSQEIEEHDIEDYIQKYLKTNVLPELVKMFGEFRNDIVRLRPNMGQTISNWWGNVKKFGQNLWGGKWKQGDNSPITQHEQVYNAKLYNLVETYAVKLCNESNVNNIEELITQFYNKVIEIVTNGMRNIAKIAKDKGYALGTNRVIGDVKNKKTVSVDKSPEQVKPLSPYNPIHHSVSTLD
jgi:hypothetical protein